MIMYEPPVGGSIFVAWLRGRFDAYQFGAAHFYLLG